MILVAMRHARAEPAVEAHEDHARSLDARGRLEAREVGGGLAARGVVPDLVLCSDARRARETWERMEGAFGRAVPSMFVHGFYARGAAAVFESLREVQAGTVLVLGHNPEWESLVFNLCGTLVPMSTATAAVLEQSAPSWRDAIGFVGRWRLTDVVKPLH